MGKTIPEFLQSLLFSKLYSFGPAQKAKGTEAKALGYGEHCASPTGKHDTVLGALERCGQL